MGNDGKRMIRKGFDREGWLRKNKGLVVPNVDGPRGEVLRAYHHSKLTIHPSGNKMY